ncbi:MAG: 23S rRNA (adenine(2503)-C(2))-methyltransferase RlmN, partial [Chthoniobacteraceae bacterium]
MNELKPSSHTATRAGVERGRLEDLTFADLEGLFMRDGLNAFHARALWRMLYRGGLEKDVEFPPPLRRWMDANEGLFPKPPTAAADVASTDGLTRKYLLTMADGQAVETVVMGYRGRFTACVSTQAGCAMGCVFCATGQMGFVRHLRPGEIVAQVLHAQRSLRAAGEPGLRNLVLMGMGEPLHNYDA